MSGHSKWATIHRSKEIKDAKRGAIFTKLGRAISIAVRQGRGVDEAVERARRFNMPKENISRAIERASSTESLQEAMFEGFLPGGTAVLVQTLSDNHLRTAQEIRGILDKSGGSLGSAGSVGYLFLPQGEINIKMQKQKSKTEQELELIDLGAENIEEAGDSWLVLVARDKLSETRGKFAGAGYEVDSAELVMHSTPGVEVDLETRVKIEAVLEKLEDLEDVQKVWTNYA